MKIFNDWGERIESYFTNFQKKFKKYLVIPLL